MAGITLADAESKLAEYQTAESAVLSGQSYTIAGRSLTRANLRDIRDGITYWNNMVRDLSQRASGGRCRTVSPGW